ncbi:glycosyltransferase [Candidatus Gottesmanbacteria bacterium]|nr:glycosyltransferase [Candidatus Gottesmanbacteria bacterium]
MRIALLNIYNGLVERGSEVFVKELASRLSMNHEISVYQTGDQKSENYNVKKINRIPFQPHQGPVSSPLYHLWVFIFTLKCLSDLWKEKYDWVIPINGRWQVLICRILRFFRGGKILISGHAGIGFEDRWNILVGKPDIFVALNPSALSWAKKFYPDEKLYYIPNGVNIEKFKPTKRNLTLLIKKPIIICVSALLPHKRIELLIKAVNKLNSGSLLLIGNGPLKKGIEKLGASLLKERFLLIQHIPYDEIANYYSIAQVFSLPSGESEAFGLVYLEAMACNLPIVAPDDINRREIIGNAGLFGDLENIDTYSELLDRALHTDFGDKPIKQAHKFSWSKISNQYEKILKN